MKFINNIIIAPKSVFLIFLVTAVIIISSAVIELNQSKSETLELMEKQSRSLLETLLISSSNALLSSETLESGLKTRLLNNAIFIKILFEKGMITNAFLNELAENNNILRINIFNRYGAKIFSSHKDIHPLTSNDESPNNYLSPIFNNSTDTLILGIKPARNMIGSRYAVALASGNNSAIVLNVDADTLLNFRNRLGFGTLLKEAVKSNNIIYALLQDDNNIIAAAGNNEFINFLDLSGPGIKHDTGYSWGLRKISNTEIFEARLNFVHRNNVVGVFRLGLSLEPLNVINARITRRIIIMSLFLLVFGFVSLAFVFIRQNFLLLSKKHKSFEEYSRNIIDNIAESIILLDNSAIIISANNSTDKMFAVTNKTIIGKPFLSVFTNQLYEAIFNNNSSIVEADCIVNGTNKTFLISKNEYLDEKRQTRTILVINDLTQRKELEKQIVRNDRLAAMGEMASSVAHEIRNPLNAISTIVQQLNKDFEPKENIEEYKSFTKLVYSEVNRINSTIESFLRFARPVDLKKERFHISELFKQLNNQYLPLLKKKNIESTTMEKWGGEVYWDRSQIHQAFINLFENSIDALKDGGRISLSISEADKSNIIIVFF